MCSGWLSLLSTGATSYLSQSQTHIAAQDLDDLIAYLGALLQLAPSLFTRLPVELQGPLHRDEFALHPGDAARVIGRQLLEVRRQVVALQDNMGVALGEGA